MNTFTRLAEANVKNYHNHPVIQTSIALVFLAAGAVAITALARRFGKIRVNPYTHRYTK